MIYLVSNNADINVQTVKGDTPLMLAASRGHKDIVQVLLSNNAKDMTNQDGDTALDLAKKHGHKSVVQILASNPTDTALNLTSRKVQ